MFELPAQPYVLCHLCDCALCIVLLYVMLGCCGGVYMWIVVRCAGMWLLHVVDVGPCIHVCIRCYY